MGDGCILCRQTSNRRRTLSISHGHKQLNYLNWKHNELNCTNKIMKYLTGYGVVGYRFTMTHQFIEEIYDNSYNGDKKTVSKWFITQLGDLALAVWYQDDGSWGSTSAKSKNGIYGAKHVYFSTCSFISIIFTFTTSMKFY